jgi:hypothetical protein
MAVKLTDLQHDLMCELGTSPKTAVSPTVVGEKMRFFYWYSRLTSGSAWASPKLKRLEQRGLVAATEKRHYYTTAKGRAAMVLWSDDAAASRKEA